MDLERQEALRRAYQARRPSYRPATHVYAELVQRAGRRSPPVLDLGCGRTGVLRPLVAEGVPVLGLDPDALALAAHRQLRLRASAALPHLPLPEASFGVVAMGWLLEHLERPAGGLAEVARVLRPGGLLLFLTPNLAHPLVLANRLLPQAARYALVGKLYRRSRGETHATFYRANRPGRLERLLGQAGFRRRALVQVGDPSYLGFSRPGWWLGLLWERLAEVFPGLRIHLVGCYERLDEPGPGGVGFP